ncbi:DNA topoisomerase [Lactococcus insecticola]|uniref:Topoisomerase n=1 Tax=Pseudolactococcus insecticola TaxID=2709158 RepID=A0A6A0B9E8_9LACT|nr:DNA topoisomerase [Lactococcus insecticola]GFH41243.1 topoisomerase [Lactococcus insecticola]
MTTLILAEKATVAKYFSKALTGSEYNVNEKIKYRGNDYIITNASGHLFKMDNPENLVDDNLVEKYKSFDDINQMDWKWQDIHQKYIPISYITKNGQDRNKKLIEIIENNYNDDSVDTIAIATDSDPYGEGDLIAANIINHLQNKYPKNITITRLFFEDELEETLRKAVDQPKLLPLEKNLPYKIAQTRELWDYTSIALTRIASLSSRNMLGRMRIGRLKTYILNKIGNQFIARKNYVKKIEYIDRLYNEEYKIKLKRKNEETKANQSDIILPQNNHFIGKVTETKDTKTEPNDLFDLSTLMGEIQMKNKTGLKFNEKEFLQTYQNMYQGNENFVSYPRTTDTKITEGDFKKILAHKSEIANLLNIDESLLPITTSRKKFIGLDLAHGANRIGDTYPSSLDEIEEKHGKLGRLIYHTLLVKTASMFADNYFSTKAYFESNVSEELFSGYISYQTELQRTKKSYKDILNLLKSDNSDEQENFEELDDKISETALNFSVGDELPFSFIVDEVTNKKPAKSTTAWLVNMLKKDNIGTGSTRLSTIVTLKGKEIESDFNTYIIEKNGELQLTKKGLLTYEVTLGSNIADQDITKNLLDSLDSLTLENYSEKSIEILDSINDIIKHDREHFQERFKEISQNPNAETKAIMAEFNIVPKVLKKFTDKDGIEREYNSENFGTYSFNDSEKEKLEAGEILEINYVSKDKKTFKTKIHLTEYIYNDRQKYGVQFVDDRITLQHETYGEIKIKGSFGTHTFTQDELNELSKGNEIALSISYEGREPIQYKGKIEKFKNKSGEIVYKFNAKDINKIQITHKTYGTINLKKSLTLKGAGYFSATVPEDKLEEIAAGTPIKLVFKTKKGESETHNVILSQDTFTDSKGEKLKYFVFKEKK